MKIKTFTIPKNNKEIFITPAIGDIPGLIGLNKERFGSCDFDINGIPFSEFRERVRSVILKRAGEYTEKIWSLCSRLKIADTKELSCVNNFLLQEKNIIQTGHAPILAHPGALIKHSLVNVISKKIKGIGINMVVDNDACHDNCLNIPDINGGNASVKRIELLPGLRNTAFEEIGYPDPAQLTAFKGNVLRILRNPEMKKAFEDFINMAITFSGEGLRFSDLLTCARYAFLLRFGIDNLEIPVSHISETETFLHFFLHITTHAKRFVRIYNTTLREYRRLKSISSKANPLPDLMEKGYVVELPFWIWEEGGERKSLYASVANERRVSIIHGNRIIADFYFEGKDNATDNLKRLKGVISEGMKIRPKAIVNTMYSRMFLSDLFVHGVGGAKYDLVTDEIIRDFFGVEPPAYAVISATLHLPYEPFDVSETDILELKRIIKDMDYNPDRYIYGEMVKDSGMKSMIREKKELITKELHDREEKHRSFGRLRELNTLMKEKIRPLVKEKEMEMEEMEKRLRYNSLVTNREYAFCLYPEAMLRELFGLDG